MESVWSEPGEKGSYSYCATIDKTKMQRMIKCLGEINIFGKFLKKALLHPSNKKKNPISQELPKRRINFQKIIFLIGSYL